MSARNTPMYKVARDGFYSCQRFSFNA